MRSLFHFPLPCTTTLAVTVSYSNRPTAARNVPSPASCTHAPPAPLPSVAFRRPPAPPVPRLPRSGPRPTVTRSQGARHAAPPSLPRAAARSHRAPSPEYRPAAACTASPASRPPCADIRVTPPISLLALRRPQGLGWQESHRMHPFFAECAKKAPFLATSARNACFSRSRWQHPRPMHPFPGAIGRFRIHGARILPPRALFRVEEPEITHGAKMLPAPPGLSAAAACGPAERALRHATAACGPAERALRPAAQAWPACRMRPPCHLAYARRGLRSGRTGFAVRDPPRGPRTDASRHLRAAPIPPAARTHRVQETSGTTQTTQCRHKNRIPKWGPH